MENMHDDDIEAAERLAVLSRLAIIASDGAEIRFVNHANGYLADVQGTSGRVVIAFTAPEDFTADGITHVIGVRPGPDNSIELRLCGDDRVTAVTVAEHRLVHGTL